MTRTRKENNNKTKDKASLIYIIKNVLNNNSYFIHLSDKFIKNFMN